MMFFFIVCCFLFVCRLLFAGGAPEQPVEGGDGDEDDGAEGEFHGVVADESGDDVHVNRVF